MQELAQRALELAEHAPVLITHGVIDRRGEWVCTCQGEAEKCRAKGGPKPGKHPRTLHGAKDATRDSARLVELCEQYPDSNLGELVGPEVGQAVIETDGPDGEQARLELEQELRPLPGDTRRSWSGRGQRWHFQWAEGLSSHPLEPDVELRASHGHYIVVHGRHHTGEEYRIDSGPLLELPPAWLDYLRHQAPGTVADADGGPIPQASATTR